MRERAFAKAYRNARELAAAETGLPLETFPDEPPYDLDQAMARAREGADNKGFEAATTAVEMVGVFRTVAGR